MKKPLLTALCLLGLFTLASHAAEPAGKEWLTKWKNENRQWRAYHLTSPSPDKLPLTKTLISEVLAPMGINALIVEVNYGFQFVSEPTLDRRGLTKAQARELTDLCRKHGIRLIPLMNCLGHQSWGPKPGPLLRKYPEFDETPGIPQDDKKIYCREWCPLHPDVNKVAFGLLDELIDAFDADALHVGMDEVFLIGDKNCPRCKGKDVGELFAKSVNDLHGHLVGKRGVEMLMWGDRLLDSKTMKYGDWESSKTGSQRAIDLVPKDIIICDWHYELPGEYRGQSKPYPSVQFFQEKGFRVLPSTWKKPEAAVALVKASREGATDKMLGILFTGWSNGPGGEDLLKALREGEKTQPKAEGKTAKRQDGARAMAVTIRAGLKEAQSPSK
jgi:hypothetical protein